MTICEKEYVAKRLQQFEKRQKIMAKISIISFFGSIIFGGISTVYNAMHAHPVATSSLSTDSMALQKQATGYEVVLQREPKNQIAMEKLSLLRLQLKDTKGSVDILEKLVKQHPDRQDYQILLTQMKKQQRDDAHP
jgi:hypothetical protein